MHHRDHHQQVFMLLTFLSFHIGAHIFMTSMLYPRIFISISYCIKRRENEDVTRFLFNFLSHFISFGRRILKDVKMSEYKSPQRSRRSSAIFPSHIKLYLQMRKIFGQQNHCRRSVTLFLCKRSIERVLNHF